MVISIFRGFPSFGKKMTRQLPPPFDPDDPERRPSSLQEAVAYVLSVMSPEERHRIAAMPEHLLDSLNVDLGAYIRKSCGLWRGNPALLASCGADNPEDASLAIIRALCNGLRSQS